MRINTEKYLNLGVDIIIYCGIVTHIPLINVYRVEHPATKTGPWNSWVSDAFQELDEDTQEKMWKTRCAMSAITNTYMTDRSHPNVIIDFMKWSSALVCAAYSIEQLREWFSPEVIEVLFDGDYTLMKYTLKEDDVHFGTSGKQCAFNPEHVCESEDLSLLPLVA